MIDYETFEDDEVVRVLRDFARPKPAMQPVDALP
jgi:hypothetical protein